MIETAKDRIARGAARYSLNNAGSFKEDEHPRAADGKFGSGGGGGPNGGEKERSLSDTDIEARDNIIDVLQFSKISKDKKEEYIKKLKDKYGYEYKEKKHESPESVDVKNIKGQEDFKDFDEYRKYASNVFNEREYSPDFDKSIVKKQAIEKYKEQEKKHNLGIEIKPWGGSSNYAHSSTNDITIPEYCEIGVFLHELGHVIQHKEKIFSGLAADIAHAPSEYGTTNGGEAFAESFYHYITDNNYKKEFEKESKEIEKKVPLKYIEFARDVVKIDINNSVRQIKVYRAR